jgi:hypothetical protein
MKEKNTIIGSQVADNNSTIKKSKNKSDVSLKKIRQETILISFIVGFLASIFASWVYEHYIK